MKKVAAFFGVHILISTHYVESIASNYRRRCACNRETILLGQYMTIGGVRAIFLILKPRRWAKARVKSEIVMEKLYHSAPPGFHIQN